MSNILHIDASCCTARIVPHAHSQYYTYCSRVFFILFYFHTNILFTLILFLIPFPLLHFLSIFFYSITLFNFLFVLCRRLQCGHSCQYFVSTLISFLIHFPLLHFLFIFFYSITLLFLFLCCVDDCNVNTHANILFEL